MSQIMNVNNLSYEINNKKVLDDISFSIEDNTINIFLSSNNSCKTTLIKMLSGILYNNSGKIIVNNITLNKSNFKNYVRNISTILDDINEEFLCDTVIEEIKYPLINLRYDIDIISDRVEQVLKLLKIKSIVNKRIIDLSCFEKVKVLIAASLVHHPKVLLLDDILRFLNNNEKKEIREILDNIIDELDISIILTTSSLSDIEGLNNIYVLNNGRIVMYDSYDNIIIKDNELSKIGIEIPLMIDLSRKLQFYNLLDKVYYDRDKVVDKLWK